MGDREREKKILKTSPYQQPSPEKEFGKILFSQTTTSVGKDGEKPEDPSTSDTGVKGCDPLGKECGMSSKTKHSYHVTLQFLS